MQKSTRLFLLAALVLTLMAVSAYGVALAAPGLNLDGFFDILGVSQVSANATPEVEDDIQDDEADDADDDEADDVDDDEADDEDDDENDDDEDEDEVDDEEDDEEEGEDD